MKLNGHVNFMTDCNSCEIAVAYNDPLHIRSLLGMVGGSLRDVQAMAGHASLTPISRYIEAAGDGQAKVGQCVDRQARLHCRKKRKAEGKGRPKAFALNRCMAVPS